MADTNETKVAAAPAASAQPNVLITAEQLGREQIAKEMAELAKSPLDASPIPGGVFEDGPGAGTYHNAHGEPVTKQGKPVKA